MSDDAFDFVILMCVLVIFVPIMVTYSVPLLKGEVGGFDTQIEKTALKTSGEIIPHKREMTTADVLLMLVIADRYTPEPKNLQININAPSNEIILDDNFLYNKREGIQIAYAAMPNTVPIQLKLYVGENGMRKWVVEDE
ncbi:hypothetical protein [Vallitalea okinawensis]|uniref:hypothetical protein n=1 Tax=Vallitalea okinawensis TaxID=2078660 RepID=UPI000CFBC145|nr:hypothetical protein [Vallitalea okinawensis]